MKRTIILLLIILGCYVLGLGIGSVIVGNGFSMDWPGISIIIMTFVGLIVGLFVNIVLHETGHLVGGLLTGYRFLSFRIGNQALTHDEAGWHRKVYNIPGTAGQCLMRPPVLKEGEMMPYFWYNVGGVVMNMLVILICAVLVATVNMPRPMLMFVLMLMFCGAWLFLLNAIPMTPSGVPNDGKNICTLRCHPEARMSFLRMMKVMEAQTDGLRLTEMPTEWFTVEPLPKKPNVMQLSDRNIYQCWLYDGMRLDEARQVAEEILQTGKRLPQYMRMETESDLVLLELATLNRKDRVDTLWNKKLQQYVRTSVQYSPMKSATLYAYECMVNGNMAKAQTYYDEVQRNLDSYPMPGEARTALALMEKIGC